MGAYTVMTVLLAGFAFNWTGGSAVVRSVLGGLGLEAEAGSKASGLAGSGELIGILERLLALVLILEGQWAAMALLVAAKSIARFEALKRREFAEYYLVGTLTSLLVSVGVGLVLAALIR